MTDAVREQILAIRDTGAINMLDAAGVQRIANDAGYYDLVCYIEENRNGYAKFIFTGSDE